MADVNNIIRAISLILTLTGELNALVENARRKGRDITDEELDALRERSNAALENWKKAAE